MRARGEGKLLFMSSVVGRIVLPPGAAYAATKWALEALVESLAIEVAPFGVQAALLQPGPVSSGALDDVTTYTLPEDPYAELLKGGGPRDGMIPPSRWQSSSPTPPRSRSCRCGFPYRRSGPCAAGRAARRARRRPFRADWRLGPHRVGAVVGPTWCHIRSKRSRSTTGFRTADRAHSCCAESNSTCHAGDR